MAMLRHDKIQTCNSDEEEYDSRWNEICGNYLFI